ncbi:hypothetical protein COCON_G00012910 [Conger conger]|uniref:Doublecortin domain-containing protein n=1 Tax=Conger conger TaxID=82655 RepID=A0A9Q1E2X3_CONCO|nr:hypothetical protein COCON_G00012910 [Conger conger]
MSGTSAKTFLPQPPPSKTIVVYRNGDAFFTGRKFVLNQRQLSTFDSFLSLVTNGVAAPFGAVRNMYTPREGHRILDLQKLQHGEKYVAAGAERFKKIDYVQITPKKPQRKKTLMIRPVVHSRIIVSARWRKIIHESCTINVFTNGDVLVPPVRILIPKYTLRSWDRVLALVTQKVHLRTGAVYRLCTLEGTTLLGSAELESGQYYVAVGTERFRFLPYFHWVPAREVNHDNRHRVHSDVLPPLRKSRPVKEMLSEYRAQSLGDEVENPAKRNHSKHTGSYFHTKPERERPHRLAPVVSHLLAAGVGGVFRAKGRRKETTGATEVQDDGRVKADLPIDQTEAKVVEEEQYDHGEPQSTSVQQTPCDHGEPQSTSVQQTPCDRGESQSTSVQQTPCDHGEPQSTSVQQTPCDRGESQSTSVQQTPCDHGEPQSTSVQQTPCDHDEPQSTSVQQAPREAISKQSQAPGSPRPVSVGSSKIPSSPSPGPGESGEACSSRPCGDVPPPPPTGKDKETNAKDGEVAPSSSPERCNSQNPLTDLQACTAETGKGALPTSPESFSRTR